MARERLVWFEQPLPFRRRSGARVELPITDLTRAADDPIVAVETGHWFTDTGFFFLTRDLLQIAMPPADERAWVERLVSPPEPAAVREALADYADAFDLVHPELPAMQVRPTAEALAARGKGGARPAAADEEEGENEEAEPEGARALARLLPDAPTINNDKERTNFFARLDDAAAPPLAAGLILPLFYANMVLFPSPGGGHFGLPAGIDSIKFAVVGDTLWRSLWGNIAPGLPRIPAGPSLFPWLDSRYRERSAGKDPWFEGNQLFPVTLPPGHVPMPRRYLLGRHARAICAVTGMPVPCFTFFERWPNGPMYAPAAFHPVWASTRVKTGDNATPGALEYRKTSGPLRFDDWLEIGLGGAIGLGDEAHWSVPDAIARFVANLDAITDAMEQHGDFDAIVGTALARELPFRVRATAMVVKGNARTLIASAIRELPLWRLPEDARRDVVASVVDKVEKVAKIAELLAKQAKACIKLAKGMENPQVMAALEDELKAIMDEAIIDLPRRLVRERDQAESAAIADEILAKAVDVARRLFDETFPVTDVDRASLAAARARRGLLNKLRKFDPRQRNVGAKRGSRRQEVA